MCPVGLLTVDCFVHVVGPNRGIEFDRGLIQSAQSAAWTLYLRAHFSRRQRQRNGRLEGVGAGCRGLQTVSSSLLSLLRLLRMSLPSTRDTSHLFPGTKSFPLAGTGFELLPNLVSANWGGFPMG